MQKISKILWASIGGVESFKDECDGNSKDFENFVSFYKLCGVVEERVPREYGRFQKSWELEFF